MINPTKLEKTCLMGRYLPKTRQNFQETYIAM